MSVINDLVTDQRVHKTCMLLHEAGMDVTLVGRVKRDSLPMTERPYRTKRMKLLFETGVPFYAAFHFRLFFFLLFRKKDLLVSNDLDTLLPNYLNKKLSGAKLIYDSHEIFCEVPELAGTPSKKKTWERIERSIVPELKYCITVNQSIADWFNKKYQGNFKVVRNIPNLPAYAQLKTREDLGLSLTKKIVLLQGAGINIQRGAEEAIDAMQYIDNAIFLIIGGGDAFKSLELRVERLGLSEKVILKGKMRPEELMHYTRNADIGITLDKDSNINYHFSLPNKIFDYIHANLPILASPLPEIKAIIEKYNIGCLIENHDPKHIAERMQFMLSSAEYKTWKKNLEKAAAENNWEKEKKVWEKMILDLKM
ncbi:MAG: glycosyltransferase [Bacteroidia bacterium]